VFRLGGVNLASRLQNLLGNLQADLQHFVIERRQYLADLHTLVKSKDAVAGEMYLPGATIKLSKTPARVGEVPTPGQHTDEVLRDVLGYDDAKLGALRGAKAIA